MINDNSSSIVRMSSRGVIFALSFRLTHLLDLCQTEKMLRNTPTLVSILTCVTITSLDISFVVYVIIQSSWCQTLSLLYGTASKTAEIRQGYFCESWSNVFAISKTSKYKTEYYNWWLLQLISISVTLGKKFYVLKIKVLKNQYSRFLLMKKLISNIVSDVIILPVSNFDYLVYIVFEMGFMMYSKYNLLLLYKTVERILKSTRNTCVTSLRYESNWRETSAVPLLKHVTMNKRKRRIPDKLLLEYEPQKQRNMKCVKKHFSLRLRLRHISRSLNIVVEYGNLRTMMMTIMVIMKWIVA